jgi:hypothetical protein
MLSWITQPARLGRACRRTAVLALSLLLAGPLPALELEPVAHWALGPAHQLEWLSDTLFVAALGSSLGTWEYSPVNGWERRFTLELPRAPRDLHRAGQNLLVALGPEGLARIRFSPGGEPWIHSLHDPLGSESPTLPGTEQVCASPSGRWFLARAGGENTVYSMDADTVIQLGRILAGESWLDDFHAEFVDSTVYISEDGAWYRYNAAQVAGDVQGIGLPVPTYWAGVICGHTLFTRNTGSVLLRYNLEDPDLPVIEGSSEVPAMGSRRWGQQGSLFCRIGSSLRRYTVAESGPPGAAMDIEQPCELLKPRGADALAIDPAGAIVWVHTLNGTSLEVRTRIQTFRPSTGSCFAPGGCVRFVEGGFQPLRLVEGSDSLVAGPMVPMPGITEWAGDPEWLVLRVGERIYRLHRSDAQGLVEAQSVEVPGLLGLVPLGRHLVGAKTAYSLRILSTSRDTPLEPVGMVPDTSPEDVFAGDSSVVFRFMPQLGLERYPLGPEGVGPGEFIFARWGASTARMFYADGLLALHASPNGSWIQDLLAVAADGPVHSLPIQGSPVLQAVGQGLVLGHRSGSELVALVAGEPTFQSIMPAMELVSLQLCGNRLLVDPGLDGPRIVDITVPPCPRPELDLSVLPGHRLRLHWLPCPGASGYRLERAVSPWGPWSVMGLSLVCEWERELPVVSEFYRVTALR